MRSEAASQPRVAQGIVNCPGETPYGVSRRARFYITRQIAVDYAST